MGAGRDRLPRRCRKFPLRQRHSGQPRVDLQATGAGDPRWVPRRDLSWALIRLMAGARRPESFGSRRSARAPGGSRHEEVIRISHLVGVVPRGRRLRQHCRPDHNHRPSGDGRIDDHDRTGDAGHSARGRRGWGLKVSIRATIPTPTLSLPLLGGREFDETEIECCRVDKRSAST